MALIPACALPQDTLLNSYLRAGAYADCYVTDIAGRVTHAEYVEAFYTTSVFRIERLLLKWFASRPSTDDEAKQLAAGSIDRFAAWRVEDRAPNQLLLADVTGRTRSWLMVAPADAGGVARTRLYFGSAVVPLKRAQPGPRSMGAGFHALLGFHRLYSRILLRAARQRLARRAA